MQFGRRWNTTNQSAFFNKKFYLKEDADKVIAELTNKLNNARANRGTGKLTQPKPQKF